MAANRGTEDKDIEIGIAGRLASPGEIKSFWGMVNLAQNSRSSIARHGFIANTNRLIGTSLLRSP